MTSGMSLMEVRKRVGARIEPWWTHALMQNDLEEWPFKSIFITRFEKKD